jgi:hypothetical protein
MDKSKIEKDSDGKDKLSLEMPVEDVQNFTLLCMQKEKEGYFDKEISEAEMFNMIFNDAFNNNTDEKK